MSYYFVVVGLQDTPLYELEFGTSRQGGDGSSHFDKWVSDIAPYVSHASLDLVDEMQWTTTGLYFKALDDFYGYTISAFMTGGCTRFVIMHDTRNEEAIRQFFWDVYDMYVKMLMSPFRRLGDPIETPAFDSRVRALAKKYL